MLIDKNLPATEYGDGDTALEVTMTFTLSSTPASSAQDVTEEFLQWLSTRTMNDYEATVGKVDRIAIVPQ